MKGSLLLSQVEEVKDARRVITVEEYVAFLNEEGIDSNHFYEEKGKQIVQRGELGNYRYETKDPQETDTPALLLNSYDAEAYCRWKNHLCDSSYKLHLFSNFSYDVALRSNLVIFPLKDEETQVQPTIIQEVVGEGIMAEEVFIGLAAIFFGEREGERMPQDHENPSESFQGISPENLRARSQEIKNIRMQRWLGIPDSETCSNNTSNATLLSMNHRIDPRTHVADKMPSLEEASIGLENKDPASDRKRVTFGSLSIAHLRDEERASLLRESPPTLVQEGREEFGLSQREAHSFAVVDSLKKLQKKRSPEEKQWALFEWNLKRIESDLEIQIDELPSETVEATDRRAAEAAIYEKAYPHIEALFKKALNLIKRQDPESNILNVKLLASLASKTLEVAIRSVATSEDVLYKEWSAGGFCIDMFKFQDLKYNSSKDLMHDIEDTKSRIIISKADDLFRSLHDLKSTLALSDDRKPFFFHELKIRKADRISRIASLKRDIPGSILADFRKKNETSSEGFQKALLETRTARAYHEKCLKKEEEQKKTPLEEDLDKIKKLL